MVDRVNMSWSTGNGAKYLMFGRRNLINSGPEPLNRKKVKTYYVYGHKAVSSPRSVIRNSYYGGSWSSTSTDIDGFAVLGGTFIYQPDWTPPFGWQPLGSSQASAALVECTNKLIRKVIRANVSDFNAGVFLAEINTTVGMFANVVTRVAGAISALKRGDIARAHRSVFQYDTKRLRKQRALYGNKKAVQKDAANIWLEIKYGIMPLLADLDSAAKKLAYTIHNTRPKLFRLTAEQGFSAMVNIPPDVNGDFTTFQSVIDRNKVQLGIYYTVSNEIVAMAASLGLTNPLGIAYEATPLSFVLDWFIPIGDFLQQLSAFHGLQFVDGWSSVSGTKNDYRFQSSKGTRQEFSYGYIGTVFQCIDYQYTTGCSARAETSGFTRQPLIDFPRPKWPKFEPKLSFPKLVTALSLLRQRS